MNSIPHSLGGRLSSVVRVTVVRTVGVVDPVQTRCRSGGDTDARRYVGVGYRPVPHRVR